MLFEENNEQDNKNLNTAGEAKATGYRIDDDDDQTQEKDLKGSPLFGQGTMQNQTAPGMEGQGMGGQNFGNEGNATPMGDDKDNPSKNAGYSNAYFARTEPLIEDTANNNFKAANQEGSPDYDKAQPATNIPGPQELPDQQKVGEDDNNGSSTPNYHEPELEEPQQDHGSSSTDAINEQDHIET